MFITNKPLKVSDFLADYKNYEERNKGKVAPLLVSNHTTGLDTFIVGGRYYLFFSVLAFKALQDIPFFGAFCIACQSIFISRTNKFSRDNALEEIKNRIDLILEGKPLPALIMFPEGTNNNGDE